jgi:hypothetical protein
MLRLFVKGAVVAVLLYAGATVGFPYYQYVMMRRAVEEAADIGVTQLEVMRKGPWREEVVLGEVTAAVTTLMQARANRVGLDLPAKGVQVSLEPDLLRVGTNWEVEATLAGYAHRFRFRVEGKRFVVR